MRSPSAKANLRSRATISSAWPGPQDQAFLGALERLHQASLEAGERRRAARAAFWIGFYLTMFGSASAVGWVARASRLLDDESEPCVERGYVLLPSVLRQLSDTTASV